MTAFSDLGLNKPRTYSLQILDENNNEIVPPIKALTLEFNVRRSASYNMSRAMFRVINMNYNNAQLIYKDRFDATLFRRVIFSITIGDEAETIVFDGNIHEAYNYKEGTDFYTEITALEGGYDIQNAQINTTLKANTSWEDVFKTLAKTFRYVTVGYIDPTILAKPTETTEITLAGNSYKLMQKYFGEAVFIDNGRVNLISNKGAISVSKQIPSITSANGLIGTPRRRSFIVECHTVLLPMLMIGELVDVKTQTLPIVAGINGQFKVQTVTHSGSFSSTVASTATTSLELFAGLPADKSFTVISNAST